MCTGSIVLKLNQICNATTIAYFIPSHQLELKKYIYINTVQLLKLLLLLKVNMHLFMSILMSVNAEMEYSSCIGDHV
jgi:hypothetical protein